MLVCLWNAKICLHFTLSPGPFGRSICTFRTVYNATNEYSYLARDSTYAKTACDGIGKCWKIKKNSGSNNKQKKTRSNTHTDTQMYHKTSSMANTDNRLQNPAAFTVANQLETCRPQPNRELR